MTLTPLNPDQFHTGMQTVPQSSLPMRITEWLMLLFIYLVPWENVLIIPGLGTLTRIVGLLLGASWIVTTLLEGKTRRATVFHFAAFVFLVWALATVLWSANAGLSALFLITLAQLILVILVIWNTANRDEMIQRLLQAFVLGSLTVALNVFFNAASGDFTTVAGSRTTIANSNQNAVGLMLTVSLPIAWYLATAGKGSFRNRFVDLVNFAYIPMAFLGVFFTASRGSLLASVWFVGQLAYLASKSNAAHRARVIGFMGVATITTLVFAPESGFQRFSTIGSSVESGDFGARGGIWQDGFREILSNPEGLIFGHGAGVFVEVVGKAAHNTLLAILLEMGVVGLVLYSSIIVYLLKVIWPMPTPERAMLFTALAIWFSAVQALSFHFDKVSWIIMAIIVGMARTLERTNKNYQSLLDPSPTALLTTKSQR